MAAMWKWCEAGSSFLSKLASNGEKYQSSVHMRNLIAVYDDVLVAWSQKEQRLLAVNIKNSPKVDRDDCQVLLLTNPPLFEVDNVLVNKSHHLLLSGPRGVTVVALPTTPAAFIKEKASCRLYSVTEPQAPQFILPVGASHGASSTISSSLGDVAVGFDFGHATAGKSPARQVFVLMGSGDVYLTHVSPRDDNSTVHLRKVLGPLTMQPQSDDNYGVDGYSLVCLQAAVPILAIATTFGTLYHCLALDEPRNETFSQSLELDQKEVSLYVFEKVKLELSLSPAGAEDDSYSCPIRLFKDPTTPLRYICSHGSGIHAVALPFIDHLQEFAEDEESRQLPSHLHADPCIVENLVCTRALPSSSPATPVGVAVVPWYPGPILVVLTNAWKLLTISLVQGYQSYLPQLLSGNPLGPRQSQRVRGQEGPPGLDHHVRQLLGGRPVPQLAQAACDCSPQQCLELLFAATQKFREEWLQRLEACQLLIGRRIKSAQEQKELQLDKLRNKLQEVACLEDRYEALRRKYEAVDVTQQKIVKRVENVLHQLHRQVPVLSAAEQSMQTELKGIQEQLRDMSPSLEQAQLKLRYQEQSSAGQDDDTAGRTAVSRSPSLSNTQVEHIRDALTQDHM
ncbi:nuclear pore complex protein Nup88, putative [Ixodes scapularis]|uniref:Nuclear pore complex protein Nup88, putative n=1 Tax=Ixodes scapularis TaxID=6945 RepID=B7QD63_IXOSC|nr:nuclear pore complex protein Nup88, putative [Ixodes scapularis]|eukprot:XP_002413477.1 nuclear pore complex protein Nup88, putative [Ixodes scapularis]